MGIGSFLIKAAINLFSKRDTGVTLTQEQAEHVKILVEKERKQISRQMHDVVDKGALEGKTVSVNSICVKRADASPEERAYIEQTMQELIEKYGENMPVNTAHRLSRAWAEEEKVWSDAPGCYERQLQRRDGNLLFPADRRIITIQEILDAQEMDLVFVKQYKKKFESFCSDKMRAMSQHSSVANALSLLQETQDMLEEAAAVGGNLEREQDILQTLETSLIKSRNDAMPDGAEQLEQARSLSLMARIPFFAQSGGKHKTIIESEVAASLLSEDLETIKAMGIVSRSFGPNFKPSEADIRTTLDTAVECGFSKQRAGKILSAWAGYA